MVVITCVDDNNGLMFNHRRQSKDQVIIENIINLIGTNRLWISPYSEKLFTRTNLNQVVVDEDYINKAQNGDYCFVENKDISNYINSIEKIILFKWNRHYPADTFLTLDLNLWTLDTSEDFIGHSHDKITKEIYIK